MKRIKLLSSWPTDNDNQAGTEIEVKDAVAEQLIRNQVGVMAKDQIIYTTDRPMPKQDSTDDPLDPRLFMSEQMRRDQREALAAADAAGGINEVAKRTAATAHWRK